MSKEHLVDKLAERLRRLGAPDPEGWARSEIDEGIPQLARFLFLRQAWKHIVSEDDARWVNSAIASFRETPAAPFSGVGRALNLSRARVLRPRN